MTAQPEGNFRYKIDVQTPDMVLFIRGRDAWALQHLIQAGDKGVTPLERPAPRWSAYIHKLRQLGLDIETIYEEHGGMYSGQHGRYVLHTPCELIQDEAVENAA